MHCSTKETQICSPELGVATIRTWAVTSPFTTGAMVVNVDINLDSSKYQIYPSNFVLLKALDKLCKFGNFPSQTQTIACVYLKVLV